MNLFGGHDDKKEGEHPEKKEGGGDAAANVSNAGSDAGGGDDGSKVGNMPEGDYVIHILIIQAKSIRLEGEDSCDPLIKI